MGSNTVILTEEETNRIRNTVQTRLERCKKVAGHEREPREAKAAISEATGASLMADMGSSLNIDPTEAGTLPALGVGQNYPPCKASRTELAPMRLGDLRLETRHRGKRLVVRRASPVVTLAARSWTMVQDEDERETERLEICLHKTMHGKDILESARWFVIKEPYFTLTDQGEATLRIDHPSDLVVTSLESLKGAKEPEREAGKAEERARKCKDKGNAALEKQDLPLAYANYTEGLQIANQEIVATVNPDLARDLYRNRAHVNLLLEQLDEARTDALSSLIGKDDPRSKQLDSKAYFRAGLAAYNLGDYPGAKRLFEQRSQLAPDIKDTVIFLRRIAQRLREQASGSYDFAKLRAGLSRARPRVDAASYPGPTEVRDSGAGRGRGLFATRTIPAGGLVLAERALCVVWGFEPAALTAMTYDVRDDFIRLSPVGLTRALVQRVRNNPSLLPRLLDLTGGPEWDDSDTGGQEANGVEGEALVDGRPAVDVFRVHDIMSRNTFGPGAQPYSEEGARHASTGLWTRAAYINHSCAANAQKEAVGDLMLLRATRRIEAGEEVFHSYSEAPDLDARQKALSITWGFRCACALCQVELRDEPAVRKKRGDLVEEAERFVEKEPARGASRRAVVRAQRLAALIEDTYDAKRYEGLPRLGSKRIQEWLAEAKPAR